MASREAITAALALARAAYPSQAQNVDPGASVGLWEAVLDGVTDDQLGAAIKRHLQTSKFWPSPANIMDYLRALAPASNWEEAWEATLAACRSNESKPVPDGPPVHQAAWGRGLSALGSWEVFGMSEEADLPSWRACFRDAYNGAFKAETARSEAMGALPGHVAGLPAPVAGLLEGIGKLPKGENDEC